MAGFEKWESWFSFQNDINPQGLTSSFDPKATKGVFNNKVVAVPGLEMKVLGESQTDTVFNRRIEIDLTNQRLYAYEDGKLVYNFLISSGKWNRTPTGTFQVWSKIRSQKMSGGSKELGTYYYLPNVPYILFFYNDKVPKRMGYSLHGTYWHNNFGTPMSHGCINMKTDEVAQIFSWAEVGTEISIYGKYQAKISLR